jgi:hypothetical protein
MRLFAASKGSACDVTKRGVSVMRKQRTFPKERKRQEPETYGLGSQSTLDSKLILSYVCGDRDAEWACWFMADL